MGAAVYRGRGFKGRAGVSGDRPIGAARCREQYDRVSCQSPPRSARAVCTVGPTAHRLEVHRQLPSTCRSRLTCPLRTSRSHKGVPGHQLCCAGPPPPPGTYPGHRGVLGVGSNFGGRFWGRGAGGGGGRRSPCSRSQCAAQAASTALA